jgi:prepilin-type N-terminal cleavage/methylation domain-containing protein
MRTCRGREAGLTLIEMLIAVALLGIVLLGIAPLFIASVRSNYAGNEYTSIHNLARDRLEQLMNLPVTDPQLTVGAHANDLPGFLPNPATGTLPSTIVNPIQRTYTVAHYTSTGGATGTPYTLNNVGAGVPYEFKRIDVTVTSTNGGSGLGIGQRTARVTGFVRNPAPLTGVN